LIPVFAIGCSKNTIPTQKSTSPLPNTIDKTDTLKVMAYNVLNYGDGCHLTVLMTPLKTIKRG
jgi:hypothetical protein